MSTNSTDTSKNYLGRFAKRYKQNTFASLMRDTYVNFTCIKRIKSFGRRKYRVKLPIQN